MSSEVQPAALAIVLNVTDAGTVTSSHCSGFSALILSNPNTLRLCPTIAAAIAVGT
jgi:hypothetical protein